MLREVLETRKWPWLPGAGVTLGCFALARENALVLPPIVALRLLLGFRGEPASRRTGRASAGASADRLGGLGLLVRSRAFEEAISHWKPAIPATPDDPSLYLNLAKVLLHLGRTARAAEQIERGIERVPDDRELRQLLDAVVRDR